MNIFETIAAVCHEANRAYCQAMGDHSQPRWEDAPDWQKTSCIEGVKAHILDPQMSPGDSHDAWMRHKAVDGWVYGETKDPVAKTHPCMRAYDQLPAEQRAKDYIFKAVVNTMAHLASTPV